MAIEKVSKLEAVAKGLRRYFTGEPCMRGHIAERQTTNGRCLVCSKETSTNYRTRNPEKIFALSQNYKKANPEWNREQNAKYQRLRRARQKSGTHTPEDIQEIIKSQKGKCAVCKIKLGDDYHTDHIIPLVRGGNNLRSNIQVLCPDCNVKKGSRDPIDFMRSRGKLL